MNRITARLLSVAAVALVALLAATGLASARTANLSPGGAITSTSSALTFNAAGLNIICEVRLIGNLRAGSRSAAEGTQFGSITSARIPNETCSGGRVSAALFPTGEWKVKNNNFLGTFPNAATGFLFTIERSEFLLETFGGFARCLYSGEARALQTLTATRTTGVYTTGSQRALTERLFSLVSGPCGTERGSMSGTFNLSSTQTITLTEP